MTVASTTRKTVPVIGNGVATAFPFGFKVFAKADISFITTVIATGVSTTLVLDSDYSVVLNADQDNNPGGTVTYPLSGAILPATKEAQIISNVIATQALNLPAGGGNYNAQVIEDSLDKALIVAQQLIELGARSLSFPPIDSNPGQIPSAVTRALQTLAFDAAGNPIAGSPSSAIVSSPMQPVVAAATLALARTALGINAQILWGGTAGGTANALTLTPTNALEAHVAGNLLVFKANATNTGATAIVISGLASKAIQNYGAACVGGELIANLWYVLLYDGAAYQLTDFGQASYVDTIFTLLGSADLTKQLAFEVDTNVPTGTKVVLTAPKASGVVATTVDPSGAYVIPYFIEGYQIVNNGAASMDVQTGVCADGNNTHMLTNGGTITKTQGAWAAGTGNGGKMSAAAMANNTWYYFYALRKDTDGTVDIGFDVSPTAPTAQAGYAAANYRYIGARKSQLAATNWDTYIQHGDQVTWSTPPALDVANAALSTANRTLTTVNVPAVKVEWIGKIHTQAATGIVGTILLTDPATADIASNAVMAGNMNDTIISNTTTTTLITGGGARCWTNTSSQIGTRQVQASTASIQTVGWRDPRGKPV